MLKKLSLLFGSLCIVFIIGEILARAIPFPSLLPSRALFDQNLGYRRPSNKIFKFKNDGVDTFRKTNSKGFLDLEWPKNKNGKFRIGIFGDSFVEAIHTPLDKTFPRLFDEAIKEKNYEVLSFGRAGYGTLHSFIECQNWLSYFDLDLVIYAFYENDPGDHMFGIKRNWQFPYAKPTNGHYKIVNHGRENIPLRLTFNIINWVRSHSKLMGILIHLTELTIRNFHYSESFTNYMKTIKKEGYPDSSVPPQFWSDHLRAEGEHLTETLLKDFEQYTKRNGADFAVLYIPSPNEYHKPFPDQISWGPWLEKICKRINVRLIDPRLALIKYKKLNNQMYRGHLSLMGHQAVAEKLVAWFTDYLLSEKRNTEKSRHKTTGMSPPGHSAHVAA